VSDKRIPTLYSPEHASRASLAIYGGVSETVDYGAEGSPHLWRGSPNLQVGVTHNRCVSGFVTPHRNLQSLSALHQTQLPPQTHCFSGSHVSLAACCIASLCREWRSVAGRSGSDRQGAVTGRSESGQPQFLKGFASVRRILWRLLSFCNCELSVTDLRKMSIGNVSRPMSEDYQSGMNCLSWGFWLIHGYYFWRAFFSEEGFCFQGLRGDREGFPAQVWMKS